MKYRTRTFYADKQKSEMWDRWQRGESMSLTGGTSIVHRLRSSRIWRSLVGSGHLSVGGRDLR